jgi:hypothetical protein
MCATEPLLISNIDQNSVRIIDHALFLVIPASDPFRLVRSAVWSVGFLNNCVAMDDTEATDLIYIRFVLRFYHLLLYPVPPLLLIPLILFFLSFLSLLFCFPLFNPLNPYGYYC